MKIWRDEEGRSRNQNEMRRRQKEVKSRRRNGEDERNQEILKMHSGKRYILKVLCQYWSTFSTNGQGWRQQTALERWQQQDTELTWQHQQRAVENVLTAQR